MISTLLMNDIDASVWLKLTIEKIAVNAEALRVF